MKTLKLQEGIIYGPIRSRRLGSSLGINLLPVSYKLCSFNCLYCHYGWTKGQAMSASSFIEDLPTVDQVKDALARWLKISSPQPDYITFSGNGEPCLHPEFDKMVEVALEIRDKYVPDAKVAILSNSTCLDRREVLAGLKKLDVRIMKLDCGTHKSFQRLNRPCEGVNLEKMVENLKKLEDIIIQSVFVKGRVDSTEEDEVKNWAERLSLIKPREVQIYSIDRPVADKGLALVTKEELKMIAQKAEKTCGIPVKVF